MRNWLLRNWPIVAVWFCLSVMASMPVYAALHKPSQVTWVQVFEQPTCATTKTGCDGPEKAPSSDEAFGRQLDILTSFYQTIINWLVLLVATITALAFYTIRATSRQEAERIAREVIESEDFRGRVVAKVAAEVENQIGDISRLVEELQRMYEALDDIVGDKERGDEHGNREAEATEPSRKSDNEE